MNIGVVDVWSVVALITLVALIVRYPRPIVASLTLWKGGPKHRSPYAVHAAVVPAADGFGADGFGADGFGADIDARIAVAGDIGHAGAHLDATGAAMAWLGARLPFDALLLLGDHAYPRGNPKKLSSTVFRPFGAVLGQGTELLAVLGNHDVLDGHGDEQLRVLGMAGRWWARDLGNLLLIGLDSNAPGEPDQLEFLERTLATTRARFRIVALHHPPYSAGYQGSDRRTRGAFAPLFARHHVDLVLSAHDHDYQRSVPIDGVTYIVTGGAAHARFTGTRSFTAVSYRVHHFVEIIAYADRLVIRAIDREGRVFDEFTRSETRGTIRGATRSAS